MAAVPAQNATMTVVTYPQVTDETRQMLAQERIRLLRQPEMAQPAVDLHRNEKYIFRSRPGTHRMIYHDFDVPPLEGSKNFDFYNKGWETRQIKAAGLTPDSTEEQRKEAVKAARKRIDDLTFANDGTKIVFNRVRRTNECYWATNNELLAAYVRDLVKRRVGEFVNVYEVSGKSRVVVGDKAFPDTELGWQTARTYARDHNIDDIKLVKE